MSVLSVQSPYPIFTDTDGDPLESGYIWIGVANLDPQVNPLAVFWDAALTMPAVQPIRTLAGYPSQAGSPGRIYTNADHSIRVQNKRGTIVFTAGNVRDRFSADLIGYVGPDGLQYTVQDFSNSSDVLKGDALIAVKQPFSNAISRNQHDKNAEMVSVFDFMTDSEKNDVKNGTYLIDVATPIKNALASGNKNIFFPQGIYRIESQIIVPTGVGIFGIRSGQTPRWRSGWIINGYGTVFAIAFGAGGSSIADSAFTLSSRSTIDGCNFWYPLQSGDTASPAQYPPTLALADGDSNEYSDLSATPPNKGIIFCPTVKNCIFVNSWIGFQFTTWHELLIIENVGISAWYKGGIIDLSTDVDKIRNLQFNYRFIYDYKGAITNSMFDYSLKTAGATGLTIGRADGAQFNNVCIIGFRVGLLLQQQQGQYPNGLWFSDLVVEGQKNCIYMDGFVQNINISNSYTQGSIDTTVADYVIKIAGNAGNKSRGIYFNNVVVLPSYTTVFYAENTVFSWIKNCNFGGCYNDINSTTFCIILSGCSGIDIHNSTIAVNPNKSDGVTPAFGVIANLATCDNVFFTSNIFYGQSQNISMIYCTNCTQVKAINSRVQDTLSTQFLGQAGSTKCYGETPLTLQREWTPTLTGFPANNGLIARFSESNGFAHIEIQISFATPQTLTFAAGLYISGLPVSLKNNVAFSAADGNSGASYGHALGSAATNRIFPQSASNVDKLVISGTYCTYP